MLSEQDRNVNMAVNHDAPTSHTNSSLNKMSKIFSKYLPTDRETFSIRYSLTGLVISIFALQLFFFYIWFADGIIFVHGFYVIIASVHFGLYQGLNKGKLRLITPWLFWKIIEIVYTIVIIVMGTMKRQHRSLTANVILAFFIVAFDILLMFFLYKHQVETPEVRNFEIETVSKKATPDV
ncbi:hypothetical protein HHI36_009384 [Cryptolaemus montrouzieri]|uniref:Uncharacterized protein n=1 Tax=Cryptolaemus montrouzieri TaxID=559131 RepID=A0ABD2MV81_9CUCU